MKYVLNNKIFIVVSLLSFLSLHNSYASTPIEIKNAEAIFDKYKVKGSFQLYDYNKQVYLTHNPMGSNTGYSPASTFKIPNTLIALEAGVITVDTIFRWEGEKRRYPRWESDMDITQAYKVSNVPVYQEIARSIGLERMQNYVRLLHYGNMDISENNLDKFWLEGKSNITLYQQIYFLKQLYENAFPLKVNTMQQMKQIMLWEMTGDYVLRAKTGWTETDLGWFIGYYEIKGNVYFFATLLEPTSQTDMSKFGDYRILITKEILTSLRILK